MSGDRKKSWKEIDQAREKGSGRSRNDPTERNRERASKTAAYSSYKSKLDQLFKPGGAELPESMREKLGPVSEDKKLHRQRLADLQNNPSEASLRALLEAGSPLPDDARLLMRLMDVRDETLLQSVLRRLSDVLAEGQKVNRMLLTQRIQSAETFAEEAETRELLRALRDAI